MYGIGISSVLAANAALEVGTLAAATLDTQFHELTYGFDIDGLERIVVEELVAKVQSLSAPA